MESDEKESEKQVLLGHANAGYLDGTRLTSGVRYCHPGGTAYRYTVLVFLCLTGVGGYFVLDSPAALEDHILTDLDISVARYMLLYSAFQWAQLVACLISGYLTDKVFGNRWAMLVGCGVVTIAQALFGLGAHTKSFMVMCLGRILFGIVEATALGIAVNNIAVRWFKSRELNMVIGIKTSLGRASSVIQMNVMGPIYSYMNTYFEGHTSLSMSLYIGACVCLLSSLCAFVLFLLDKKGDDYSLNKDLQHITRNDVKLSDITTFPVTFWLTCAVISCYLCSVLTFVGLGMVYFQMKYGKEPSVAANINSLVFLISIFVMPVSGWMVDKFGRSLFWIFLGLALGLISHVMMAFTFINPYLPVSVLGISYSIITSTIWPMIPYLVDLKYCATGFGIMNAAIAIVQSGITYLAGYLADHGGYLVVEIMFISGISVALILTSLIYLIDSRRGAVLLLKIMRCTATVAMEYIE